MFINNSKTAEAKLLSPSELTEQVFLCYFLLQGVESMRETITVSIPEEIKKQVDKIMVQEGTTRSSIIKESLQDYLFIRQFRSLRKRMMEKSPRAYTDQDIFNRVS